MTEDERLDDLQLCGMRILQKTKGFRFGMDAVLLSDFAATAERSRVADFGTGTGILPLLMLGRGYGAEFHALELQPEMADMAQRTMQLNGVADRIHVYCASVEQAPSLLGHDTMDAVVCNPPYGTPGTTMTNPSEALRLARHQGEEGLLPWYRAARLVLKGHGRFYMVYPAQRLPEALQDLRTARL